MCLCQLYGHIDEVCDVIIFISLWHYGWFEVKSNDSLTEKKQIDDEIKIKYRINHYTALFNFVPHTISFAARQGVRARANRPSSLPWQIIYSTNTVGTTILRRRARGVVIIIYLRADRLDRRIPVREIVHVQSINIGHFVSYYIYIYTHIHIRIYYRVVGRY